jgi:hypothetical protein
MIKRIWILLGMLVFFSIKTYLVFADNIAFPRLTFPALSIATEEEQGPFYTSAPEVLPRHDWYLGCRYMYSAFKAFWGKDLDAVMEQQNPNQGRSHVDSTEHAFQCVGAYGITDRLLLGTMIPWKKVSFARTWEGDPYYGTESDGLQAEKEGVGDVVVSARYQLFKELGDLPFSWAVGVDIKLPTGSDHPVRVSDQSVGTGTTDYKALTMLSKRFRWGTAYSNLGYTRDGRDRIWDTLEYNLALVFPITKSCSLSGEVLGVSFVNWATDPDHPHSMNTYDAGLAVKFRAKGITVEFGVKYPLNEDFMRTRWQPTIGINYVF